MSDGRIYITITDERNGGGSSATDSVKSGGGSVGITNISSIQEKSALADFVKHKFHNLIESEAKTLVNYSISNIGNFQGDFQTQREMQYGMTTLSNLVGIGTATISGAMYGGVVGAIAGFTVASTSLIVNRTLENYSGQVAVNQQNYSIEQLRRLSGLSELTNGSR